jgi:hypothetical protein
MIKRISPILFFASAVLLAVALSAAEVPEGVPKDATEVAPGTYRLVDKDGKAWVYRKTPFGMSRRAEEESQPASDAKPAREGMRMTPFGETKARDAVQDSAAKPATTPGPETRVIEEGDTVRFERPSPFGVYKWSRRKDELTAEERRLWQSHKQPGATGNNAK